MQSSELLIRPRCKYLDVKSELFVWYSSSDVKPKCFHFTAETEESASVVAILGGLYVIVCLCLFHTGADGVPSQKQPSIVRPRSA